MDETMNRRRGTRLTPARIVGWGTIVALIGLPAVAMQFTREVNWTKADFAFAIVMLGGTGLAFELAVRASGSRAYRAGAAIALGAGLLLVWANAAVGIVGSEDADINRWFDLIPLVALLGAACARFRPGGMAMAMLVTALAQIVMAAIMQHHGHFTWLFTAVWGGAWLLSAWLFRQSARHG